MSNAETPKGGNKLKELWADLTPANKRKYSVFTIMAVLIAFFIVGYQVNRGGKHAQTEQNTGNGRQIVDLHSKLLEKTDIREKEKDITSRDIELKEKDAMISDLTKQMEDIKSGAAPAPAANGKRTSSSLPSFQAQRPSLDALPMKSGKPALPPLPQERSGQAGRDNSNSLSASPIPSTFNEYPPAPLPPSQIGPGSNSGRRDSGYKTEQDIEIGDIAVVSNAPAGAGQRDVADTKAKKKEQKIYLPPSHMEATLLSGLDAPTSIDGKAQAAPTLIRIATPAVLPNEVKMQLKGCYVIAECTGNLSSERADCRLVSLSCLARDGRALIDQKVKGFLVDQDGKLGLNGKVVAKMGQMLARSALAGFFGGIGKAYSAVSSPSVITGTGIVMLPDSESVLKSGIGSGISQASTDLQKFYLELGRQTLPVIEIGASKRVTLVTSEGVDLDIKMHCDRTNAFGDVVCKEYDEQQQQ